jgi:AcrR family transcriptional regulator
MSRPDVTDERKRQILAAAATAFARAGFAEARMDDIAAEAGLSKGALYLYFRSKDEIVAALMRALFEVQLEDLRELLASHRPFRDCLLAFTDHLIRQYAAMGAHGPVAREFYAVAGRQKHVRSFVRDYFRTYRRLLADLVRSGVERGEVRDADPDTTALAILGIYEGLFLIWTMSPRDFDWATTTRGAIELLLSGIAPRRPGEQAGRLRGDGRRS